MRGASRGKSSKGTIKSRKSNKRPISSNKVSKGIKTLVKKEIARNVENKITVNASTEQSILAVNYNTSLMKYITDYISWAPQGDGDVLTIQQGTAQDQRIGNKIKLKRWVVKGSVYYDPNAFTGALYDEYFQQAQGFVDIYFGRQLNMGNVVPGNLQDLYQNGGTTFTPTGALLERTYSINKDEYKIYWHKRYKIGAASTLSGYQTSNNDYKLNQEFGFDICKLVCKNKVLKYSDSTNTPEDQLVSSLTLWATFTCPSTNIQYTYTAEDNTAYSPAKISVTSYAEYEDA